MKKQNKSKKFLAENIPRLLKSSRQGKWGKKPTMIHVEAIDSQVLFRDRVLLKQSEEFNKTSSPKNKQNWKKKNNSKQLFQDSKSQSGTNKELRNVYSWKSVRTLDDKSGSLQRVCIPLAWICCSLIPPPKAWSMKQSCQSRTAHEKQQLHCWRGLTWFGRRAKTPPWQHYQQKKHMWQKWMGNSHSFANLSLQSQLWDVTDQSET